MLVGILDYTIIASQLNENNNYFKVIMTADLFSANAQSMLTSIFDALVVANNMTGAAGYIFIFNNKNENWGLKYFISTRQIIIQFTPFSSEP
jgi:subtilase family serine protease